MWQPPSYPIDILGKTINSLKLKPLLKPPWLLFEHKSDIIAAAFAPACDSMERTTSTPGRPGATEEQR